MVESLVQRGNSTVAVTGYLKGNDKKRELGLASLLPQGTRKLMGREEKGGGEIESQHFQEFANE